MTVINKQPTGLLGFLGIKNFGRNPDTLSPTLAPTWDLAQLYLNATPEYFYLSGTENAVGYSVIVQPPENEIWYVHEGGLEIGTGAGVTMSVFLARANGVSADAVPLTTLTSVAASSRAQLVFPHPMILEPGASLGYNTRAIAGVASTYYAIRYTRLQV